MWGAPQAPGVLGASIRRIKVAWAANRKHVASFSSFIVLRFLALGAFAVSVPIFINNASEVEYGVVAIGFSVLGLTTVFDVGIGYVVIQLLGRRVARTGLSHPRIFNRLFWFNIIGMALVTALLLAAMPVLPLPTREKAFYGWLVGLLPFLAASGMAAAVYQAHGDLVYLNGSRFLFEIGKGIAVALSGFWFLGYSAIGPLLLGIAILRALTDLFVLRIRLGYVLLRPKQILSRWTFRLAAHGLPAAGAALLSTLVYILDKVLIALWLTKQDVAYYSLAFDVSTKAYMLVYALNSTMLTIWLHNYARRIDSATQTRFALAAVLALSILYYVPLGIWSEELIGLWVNDAIAREAAALIRVMVLASVLYLFGNVFEVSLLARAGSRMILGVNLVAVCAYMLSIIILSPMLSLRGFAWGYFVLCLTYCLGMITCHLKYAKRGELIRVT